MIVAAGPGTDLRPRPTCAPGVNRGRQSALTVARARWELDGLDGVLDGWQQEAGA